jgi:hypothetical protein
MSGRVKYTLGDLPLESAQPVANVWGSKVMNVGIRPPVALGHRYKPLLRKLRWLDFLKAEWEVYDDPEESYVSTHAWAQHLVLDNIVPMLERLEYTLNSTKREFVDCMLNYMFRHEEDFAKARPTTYRCKHCRRYESDQAEFFHQRKLPAYVWQRLQRTLAIEHWSDGEEFADRFWLDLPHIVFAHCDMEKSGATKELDELLHVEDEEEDAGKRQDVDPYLMDYYGGKYKKKAGGGEGGGDKPGGL